MKRSTTAWLYETGDRVVRSFVQGYVTSWLVFKGPQYDTMLTITNLKAGGAMAGLALAMALGFKQVGSDHSTSQLIGVPDKLPPAPPAPPGPLPPLR